MSTHEASVVKDEKPTDGNSLVENNNHDMKEPNVEETEKNTTVAEGDDASKAGGQSYAVGTRKDSVDNNDDKELISARSTRTNSAILSATQKVTSVGGFKVRPDLSDKFRPGVVQSVIEKILREFLEGRSYSAEDSSQWTRNITNAIHAKVKGLDYKRYKLVTFVVLGEYRGEGISVSNRCLWDADTDCKATYKFINDSLFCVGSVYGFYYY